jgi:hypothetical protein
MRAAMVELLSHSLFALVKKLIYSTSVKRQEQLSTISSLTVVYILFHLLFNFGSRI